MTENEIIRGCIEGYPEFQKALYEKHYKQLMGICIRYSDNEEDAHRMLQNGFVNIYKNIKKYKSEEPINFWLKKALIESCIAYIRNDKEKRMIVSTVHENKGVSKQKTKEISDEYIVQNINKKVVLIAIHSLTSGYRIILNLFLIDGFNFDQIAEILNISADTCKSNLEKAMFAFRKNLIQQLNNYGE
jgi:RNA polymerase sigma factor (sigma-70 family)